jgi:hypothetical protein
MAFPTMSHIRQYGSLGLALWLLASTPHKVFIAVVYALYTDTSIYPRVGSGEGSIDLRPGLDACALTGM